MSKASRLVTDHLFPAADSQELLVRTRPRGWDFAPLEHVSMSVDSLWLCRLIFVIYCDSCWSQLPYIVPHVPKLKLFPAAPQSSLVTHLKQFLICLQPRGWLSRIQPHVVLSPFACNMLIYLRFYALKPRPRLKNNLYIFLPGQILQQVQMDIELTVLLLLFFVKWANWKTDWTCRICDVTPSPEQVACSSFSLCTQMKDHSWLMTNGSLWAAGSASKCDFSSDSTIKWGGKVAGVVESTKCICANHRSLQKQTITKIRILNGLRYVWLNQFSIASLLAPENNCTIQPF